MTVEDRANPMFIAVYRFKIFPDMEQQFIQAWKIRTEGIYFLLGSLGSRLHQESSTGDYIAYAQWPSRSHWLNAQFDRLNTDDYPRYKHAGEQMRKSIQSDETILELEVEADYLHPLLLHFK